MIRDVRTNTNLVRSFLMIEYGKYFLHYNCKYTVKNIAEKMRNFFFIPNTRNSRAFFLIHA